MIPLLILAFILGALAGAWVVVVTTWVWTLRRQLKAAQKALEVKESMPQPSIREVQERINRYDAPRKDDEPRFSGIGPTDIGNRELYERQQAEKLSTPQFASPSVLNPSIADIELAAREATNHNN